MSPSTSAATEARDSRFEESRPGQSAGRRTEPDLAALLDNEYVAISGGRATAGAYDGADAARGAELWGQRPVSPGGPGEDALDQPLAAPVQRTQEEKAAILARVSPEWLSTLNQQVSDLYEQVTTTYSSPPANAERAMGLLREARAVLTERPEDYSSAEFRVAEVRAMLGRTANSRQSGRYYGPRIFFYELGWLALFAVGLTFGGWLANWIGWLSGSSVSGAVPTWNVMMWGGVGGVVGAMYHLWWHITDRQDFDPQYLMWYMVQPVMGVVLGGIIYLILATGFLVLEVNLSGQNAGTAARLLPYLAAVLGGFRQNFVYEQIDRVIGVFSPGARDKDTTRTS
jgi:hypothetical protein